MMGEMTQSTPADMWADIILSLDPIELKMLCSLIECSVDWMKNKRHGSLTQNYKDGVMQPDFMWNERKRMG